MYLLLILLTSTNYCISYIISLIINVKMDPLSKEIYIHSPPNKTFIALSVVSGEVENNPDCNISIYLLVSIVTFETLILILVLVKWCQRKYSLFFNMFSIKTSIVHTFIISNFLFKHMTITISYVFYKGSFFEVK